MPISEAGSSDIKALERIYMYPLTWKQLQELPEDQAALLAVVSFAVSEMNVLQRAYLGAAHQLTGELDVDLSILIQRHVLLRTWSAKLFELASCFSDLVKEKRVDEKVAELSTQAFRDFEELRDDDTYAAARAIRNEAASHYSFKAAKKNIPFVSDRASCNLFFHTMDGNSYYPLGDEVMFAGRFNRQKASASDESRETAMIEWYEWNLAASKWARHMHYNVCKTLLFERFPDKLAQERLLWLDPDLVGRAEDSNMPIFLRRDPQ